MDLTYILNTLKPYNDYIPYLGMAFLASFLLTPIIGFFATKFGVIDLPAKLRKSNEKNLSSRVKEYAVPRAGGLAVIIPFILIILFSQQLTPQIIAIIVGTIILTIVGVLDDKYEVNSKLQLFIQIIAIVPLLATGISVDTMQNPFDSSINLRSLVIPLTIGTNTFSLALPADIITLVWILIMINAINWLFGIDALGEGISIIAFTTILLVSVKLGNPITAVLAATAIGGILGFIPFNLYPSKIISGTAGNTVYGFLIAAFSIVGGIKVSSSVIVLLIPLIDMIWVMIGRINRHGVNNFFDIFKVTTIGDNTHLHHRLLKLGFSTVQVATIEWLAVWVCAVIAFSSGNLPKAALIGSITAITLLLFLIISILLKKGVNIRKKKMNRPTEPPTHRVDTPESRYAY